MSDDTGFRTTVRCNACDFISIVSLSRPFSTAGCLMVVIDPGAGRELHVHGASHAGRLRVTSAWGDNLDMLDRRRPAVSAEERG